MARALSPQEIADKQVRRATAAVQDYKNGVQNVTVSPTAEAAKAVDKYAAGVQQAVADGSYVNGLNSVSQQDWIAATVTKGGNNYAPGITAAKDKIVAFQTAIAPVRSRVQATVKAMPNTTFEERMARMEANARGLHEFTYKKPSKRQM